MKKRAALYVRVSTQEQAREGYSIDAQTERLKSYVSAKDYRMSKVYTDPGYSGAKLDRPGLKELISDVEKNMIDVVLVYKLDRLSRSQKHTLQLIQDVFQPHNVDFISLQESFDTSTSFGIAMVGILAVFAELERSTIRERTMLGRKERAKQGFYHGGGNYDPLGYKYVDNELIVDKYERKIVEEIYDLYIKGNSINSVAQLIWDKYPERIKSKTIVRDALKKRLYIGEIEFDGEIYSGRHEPIIDKEIFDKVQTLRKKRHNGQAGTNKQKGLLVGKIYCKHCGAQFAREVSGVKKYRYVWYTCYSRRPTSNRQMIKDPNCKNKRWKEETLNNFVIDQITKLDFDEMVNRSRKSEAFFDYDKEIKTVENQMERLLKLYSLGTIEIDIIEKKMQELQTKQKSLVENKLTLEQTKIPHEEIKRIKNFDWENEPLEHRIGIIEYLINRIEIDNNKIYIHWNF